MQWEEYGIYLVAGLVFGLLLIGLLVAELLVVRAHRRFVRDSTAELAQLLAKAGKPAEGKELQRAVDDMLESQRQQLLSRVKRRRRLRERR